MVTLSNATASLVTSNGPDPEGWDESQYKPYPITNISVQNVDEDASVFIGGANVTANSYGMVLGPGAVIVLDNVNRNIPLYAISSVNGSKVAILRILN
ncbi:MAG: hypothetical protein EBT80_00810 [Chitinophagales bacterium]|nr:hypothetical protein [Chitinophagales bacterium]